MQDATALEVARARHRGDTVIDVWTLQEFVSGHVPGAQFIPLAIVPLRLSDIDRRSPVYVVCESGGRGSQASRYLDQHGYTVMNLSGGMVEWRAAGLSIETGHDPHVGAVA